MATIKKILCAVDFSDSSAQVAGYAAELGKSLDAEILVLYVAPSLNQYVGFHVPPSSIENFVGGIVDGAEQTMDQFIQDNFAGMETSGRVVTGYAAEEILGVAKEEQAHMIIMGTHGRKGIDRILFGSVAEKVVKGADMPVLTIRPS
ncbi:universal stress protein [Desulfovibrio ferrophilus]|uniref:Universal stress protein n=1 Tax=Desulfovibrio ferrophilus TaxID=241368 RepID=A0A2Z6B2I0_9BACT|nr:universal stress protein [Desulfovibrio ferrophilus]BBD09727.1 UspA domain-containing protein [Desulfovibrio ferrophilus]